MIPGLLMVASGALLLVSGVGCLLGDRKKLLTDDVQLPKDITDEATKAEEQAPAPAPDAPLIPTIEAPTDENDS